MAASRTVDGVLLLDKPAGPSSNQALQRVRRLLEARKAGHAGTLDPLATGLLPILFGEATKFASYLSDASKCYTATVLLGTTTSTGDLAGEVLERRSVDVSAAAIESVVSRFRGAISQTPPMYSAIKQSGTPLYQLARRGEVVDRTPRRVFIEELVVEATAGDELDLRVVCSKGTYIRVLAEDIGKALGCGGTLQRLRRIAVGPIDVRDALTLDSLEAMSGPERVQALHAVDSGLEHFRRLELSETQSSRLYNGQVVTLEDTGIDFGTVRLYAASSERFLGLGDVSAGTVTAMRLLADSRVSTSARSPAAK